MSSAQVAKTRRRRDLNGFGGIDKVAVWSSMSMMFRRMRHRHMGGKWIVPCTCQILSTAVSYFQVQAESSASSWPRFATRPTPCPLPRVVHQSAGHERSIIAIPANHDNPAAAGNRDPYMQDTRAALHRLCPHLPQTNPIPVESPISFFCATEDEIRGRGESKVCMYEELVIKSRASGRGIPHQVEGCGTRMRA
jgi:hypothetical protein